MYHCLFRDVSLPVGPIPFFLWGTANHYFKVHINIICSRSRQELSNSERRTPHLARRTMSDVEEIPSADLFKVAAASILFSIALIGGILPQRLQNVGVKVVSCLNTAAGGVFFASAMVSTTRWWEVLEAERQCGLVGGACVFSCSVELCAIRCSFRHSERPPQDSVRAAIVVRYCNCCTLRL